MAVKNLLSTGALLAGLLACAGTLAADGKSVTWKLKRGVTWHDVDATDVALVARTTGLTAYDAGSKDAAIVITLAPGVYTMDVTSGDTTVGIGMVEIYLLP